MVAVGNGPSFGGGLRITEGALLDDGLLDVVVIRPIRKPELVRTYPKLFKGTHVAHPDYRHYPAPHGDGRGSRRRRLRRRRADRPAAADRRGRPAGLARAGAVTSTAGQAARARTPAERYARFRRNRGTRARRVRRATTTSALDDFQVRACEVLEDGRSVLVAAPTGSGKTLVGEFAVHLALAEGRKCFYTTPIKALSNQKFNDLVDALRRRAGRPAHRRQHHQRRGAGGGDDHRGAPQHALRRVAARWPASATS